uniref:PHD-type domain-containing protein n=1 Tax=Panagrolaimus superbus TaxID=310955 RepID=A0A914YH35_9BILA
MARPAGKGGGGGKHVGGKLTGAGGNVEDNFVDELLAFDGEVTFKHINIIPTSKRRSTASTVASSSSAIVPIITSECLQPYAFNKAKEQDIETSVHSELNHIDFMFNIPEYNMDEEDIRFLQSTNSKRPTNDRISESQFEVACNRLEKLSVFQFWKTGSTILIAGRTFIVDDRCDVCGGDNDRRNNKLLTCQICYVSVHQECYGIPYYPASSWKCRRCAINPTLPIKCAFCPFEGGSMKFTSDNKAVHQLCAIWINGITVSQNAFLEPIDINTADTVVNIHKCSLCKQTYGAVIGCAFIDCHRKMHVTCSAIARLTMETNLQVKENKAVKKTLTEEIMERIYNRKIHCVIHSKLIRDEILSAINKVTEALEGRSENMPIDLRASPINPKYIKPEFVNFQLSEEAVKLVYRYWFVKRLRRFCSPSISRIKVIYDRMARPIRHLQNEIPAPVYQAFKNRVYLNVNSDGTIGLTANFLEDFPVLNDELEKYLTNSLGDDPEVPSIDYDNKIIIFQKQALHLHSIPNFDKDIEILFCRKRSDICRVTLDLVKRYVDPTMEFDHTADYIFDDPINPWDIIGLMFFLAVPEYIQISAFISSLWFLDFYGVFRTFNYENPDGINLKKMAMKGLHKQYPTMNDAYTDFFKMMHDANSQAIKEGRLSYINKFEEAVCYSVPSKPQYHVLQLMLNEIEAEGENKYKILLKYLMHELTMNENIDEDANAMPQCNRGKLITAAEYAKSLIILEKTFPIPNIFFLTELFGRRKINNKHAKIISLPTVGFTPMNGFRQDFIQKTLFIHPFRFDTISWIEGHKLNEEKEIKLGYKLKKEINGQTKVIKAVKETVARKRRAQPPPPTSSGSESRGPPEKLQRSL